MALGYIHFLFDGEHTAENAKRCEWAKHWELSNIVDDSVSNDDDDDSNINKYNNRKMCRFCVELELQQIVFDCNSLEICYTEK